ncbi:hypothetical protein T4D_304 [Trichinella pseudospiralis]|uniref:Uncharacterized protein n=1 Tax=Trichinella pseudospiralis TaxID=6337 RepID=A0A0V1FXD6_TRIPS|nr:hypothetical protein T4D_304 [Trichinella pseudospiralis]
MSKKTNVLRDEAALVTRLKLIKECSTVNIRRLLSALQNCFVCRIPLETVLCVCSASSSSPVCSPFQSAERDGTFLACLVRDRRPPVYQQLGTVSWSPSRRPIGHVMRRFDHHRSSDASQSALTAASERLANCQPINFVVSSVIP